MSTHTDGGPEAAVKSPDVRALLAWRQRHRSASFGPYDVDGHVFTLRSPRLRDARAWSKARLANREWLERAFPAWGADWVKEQSPAAWVARWWQLRAGAAHESARPLVVFLDGNLIGELGVDAVDATSNTGEASVWMVRDRTFPRVMEIGSLVLTYAAFCTDEPLNRLVSPVATSSRRGRAPGLTAAGLTIEATLPRPVGRGEAVDHDIWVLHNTASVRARTERALASLSHVRQPPEVGLHGVATGIADVAVMIGAVAEACLRAVRNVGTPRRHASAGPRTVSVGSRVAVHHVDGTVRCDGVLVGRVHQLFDVGTATAALRVNCDHIAYQDTIVALAVMLADDVAAWAPTARWVQVRTTPPGDEFDSVLSESGFTRAATFSARTDAPKPWPGEQWWSRAVDFGATEVTAFPPTSAND